MQIQEEEEQDTSTQCTVCISVYNTGSKTYREVDALLPDLAHVAPRQDGQVRLEGAGGHHLITESVCVGVKGGR